MLEGAVLQKGALLPTLEPVTPGFRNHPLVPILLLDNRLTAASSSSSSSLAPEVYLVVMSHYENKILHSISTLIPQLSGKQVPVTPFRGGSGE